MRDLFTDLGSEAASVLLSSDGAGSIPAAASPAGSIEWFAAEQARLRAEGEASAKAFHERKAK